jgi:CheY-like chemotaxis protein
MGKVLVVDDNPDGCRLLVRVLQHMGHEGNCVTCGEDALLAVREHRPDALILDVMMPGMDGMEVLRRIREMPETSHLPVIMYTALADPSHESYAREKGATDYWVKARMKLTDMQERLDQLLPRATGQPPGGD